MKAYVFNKISKTILEIEIFDFSAGKYDDENFCSFRFPNDGQRYCLSFFNDTSDDGYGIGFLKKPTENQIKKIRKFLGEDFSCEVQFLKCFLKYLKK